jgi:hypothetical protein
MDRFHSGAPLADKSSATKDNTVELRQQYHKSVEDGAHTLGKDTLEGSWKALNELY